MKKTLILLALASAMPLAAQSFEAGLLYTWNPGHESSTLSRGANVDLKVDDSWKAAGLRFGYNFISMGPLEFQGNATYQFKNTQDVKQAINGTNTPLPGVTEGYSYWAVGAAVNWNFLVRLGVGLEYRSERLELADPLDGVSPSTTYGRGWVRGTIGFNIPAPVVKPFIGAELAVPLSSKSLNASDFGASPSTFNWDNINKSMAPKAQYGIYAGVRF